MKSSSFWVCSLLIAVFGLAGCGGAAGGSQGSGGDAAVTMKIAHATVGDAQDMAAHALAEEVNQRSGGRIHAEVYNGQQLGNNEQVNQGIQSGTIEATLGPSGFFGPFAPLMDLLELPYLFPDNETLMRVVNSDATALLAEQAQEKGFRIVGYVSLGPKFLVTTEPIRSVEDMAGMKLRSFQSPLLIKQMEVWGASSVPMAPGEVYTAMEQGVVQGTESSAGTAYNFKWYEVAPYITDPGHGFVMDPVIYSQVWYESLPADLQQVVTEAGQAVAGRWEEFFEADYSRAMDVLQNEPGVTVTALDDAAQEGFREKSQAVETFVLDEIDGAEELLQALRGAMP